MIVRDVWEDTLRPLVVAACRKWLAWLRDRVLPPGLAPAVDAIVTVSARAAWDTATDPVIMEVADLVAGVAGRDPGFGGWRDTYLQQVRGSLAGVPDSVYDGMVAAVADAVTRNATPDELRALVQDRLDESGSLDWAGRAGVIAATIATGAHSAAALHHAHQSGTPLVKVWATRGDDRVRPTHRHLDGHMIPLDGTFRAGHAQLAYPGDPTGPPAEVVGCRCHLRIEEAALVAAVDHPSRSHSTPNRDEGRPVMARQFEALLLTLGEVGRSRDYQYTPDLALVDTVLPMAFKWQPAAMPGHDGSVTIGALQSVEIRDNGLWGTGTLLSSPDVDRAVQEIGAQVTRPSVEIIPRAEVLTDPDGNVVPLDEAEQFVMGGGQLVWTVSEAELVAAALVSVPEYRDTTVTLVDDQQAADPTTEPMVASFRVYDTDAQADDAAITASIHVFEREQYPAGFFQDPGLPEPTRIHVTPDGRVLGHVAEWGVQHRSAPRECPHSLCGYAEFHNSPIELDTGATLYVGRATIGGGHGKPGAGVRATMEHYDNVGTCWAYLRAGEDEHGVWVSGALNPRADNAMVQEALNSPYSGHWEPVRGNPELLAVHSVNCEGFPVAVQSRNRRGELAMVASFMPGRGRAIGTVELEAVADRAADKAIGRYAAVQAEQRAAEARRARALQHKARALSDRRARALAIIGRPRAPRRRTADTTDEPGRADARRGVPDDASALSTHAGVRRVRTPAGERKYGQPIGSIIAPKPPSAAGMRDATPELRREVQEKHGYKIPPAWTDVQIAGDLDDDSLLVRGRDAKGRDQRVYSPNFRAYQDAQKFQRIDDLDDDIVAVDEALSRDAPHSDAAAAVLLIRSMGLRPGSDRDTGAEKAAYGATNLRAHHVVDGPDGMQLQFTGKKGVDISLPVTDPETQDGCTDDAA